MGFIHWLAVQRFSIASFTNSFASDEGLFQNIQEKVMQIQEESLIFTNASTNK